MSYISRALEPVLERAAREFPAVVLTGARQTGKTTLLQHLFGERYRYVSLETPDTVSAAGTDPRGFLQIYAPPVILDEVQNAPHRADRGIWARTRFRWVGRNGEVSLLDGLGTTRATGEMGQAVTSTLQPRRSGIRCAWGDRDDGDAGLLHVGARCDDPQVWRFTLRDAVLSEHPYL